MISIIGNGSSNKNYVSHCEYVFACNIPQHGHAYNSLSIIDNQPINWMKNHAWRPSVPVFCTPSVKEYARKKCIEGDFMPVYVPRERYNAGLHCARHCAKLTSELHLWGFDSLWSKDLTSDMDLLVPRHSRPSLNKWWHPHWQAVFEDHPHTRFVVHLPDNQQLDVKNNNVIADYFKEVTKYS